MTSFEEMLTNVYSQLGELTQSSSPNRKLVISDPDIKTSTTNTYWTNIKETLMKINRPPDHFVEFLNRQLKTGHWKSDSLSDGLVLIGKFRTSQLKVVLTEYITQYVVCRSCRTIETELVKKTGLRIYQVECSKCKSVYVV